MIPANKKITICTCYIEYPNEMHKFKNGHWKCVDKYICVRPLEYKYGSTGLKSVRFKTMCVKVGEYMTNADVIRQMNDDQLDNLLAEWENNDIDYAITFCDMCKESGNELGLDCDGCRKHWLQSDAKAYNGLLYWEKDKDMKNKEMTDEQLIKALYDYSKAGNGEISDLTYAASVRIGVLTARIKILEANNKRLKALFNNGDDQC